MTAILLLSASSHFKIRSAQKRNRPAARAPREGCTRDPLITHPDESIGLATRKMSTRDIGRLPVVARDDPRRLAGMLRRHDSVRAYDIALTRRAALRHRAHKVHLDAVSGEGVLAVEVVVQKGAPCAGKRVAGGGWPGDAVVAASAAAAGC